MNKRRNIEVGSIENRKSIRIISSAEPLHQLEPQPSERGNFANAAFSLQFNRPFARNSCENETFLLLSELSGSRVPRDKAPARLMRSPCSITRHRSVFKFRSLTFRGRQSAPSFVWNLALLTYSASISSSFSEMQLRCQQGALELLARSSELASSHGGWIYVVGKGKETTESLK